METKKQTLRQRIAHALTDRKILHFRYDAHLRQQVYKRLNALQKSLINRMSAIGVEALPAKKLDKLLTELQTEIAKTYQETTAYTQNELSGFLSLEASQISQLYNDEIGFDLFNDVPKERIKAIKNVAVIEGQPLSAWWNKQRADLAFKFEGIIRTGVAEGKQNGQLATEVRELMNVSRRTADTLVITAVAKVADTAHEALRDANLDILQGEEHLSTLDMRTSTVCQVRDGKRWDLDKKPIGHNIPYKRPPLHPRCRSILQLVTKSWEELGVQGMDEMPTSTRASMDGQVDERINYESWLHSKTHEEREKVLGKGKADLWERGVITFSDMLDQSGRALTLRELSIASSNGEKWREHFKNLNDEPIVYSEKAQELFSLMKDNKVEYNEVQKLKKQLTQQEIIDKISGGDMTEGSCASLALAYIGNKNGLDVTDFRGGISRETFARNGYKVLSLPGVSAKQYIVGRAESREVAEILRSDLVLNKEYYLSTGSHAAIVRKTEHDFEYLELQSATQNGWKSFTKNGRGKIANVLHERFKTQKLSKYRHYMFLAEVDSFKDNKEFEKILGYLNTAEDKQLKGNLGSEK